MTKQKNRRILKRLVSLCLMMALVILPKASATAETAMVTEMNFTKASSVSDLESGAVYVIRNVATSKCLAAPMTRTATTMTSTIKTETYQSGDPDQLWYFKKDGYQYTIENLGVMDFASNGQYQTILDGTPKTSLRMGNNSYIAGGEK